MLDASMRAGPCLGETRPLKAARARDKQEYEPGERNWSAYVPDLPGCIATAKTRNQLERQIREAKVTVAG
jgi:hypothetical protein